MSHPYSIVSGVSQPVVESHYNIYLSITVIESLLGHENVVKLLIENNADANAKNYFGHTSLELAAKGGDLKLAITFLNIQI